MGDLDALRDWGHSKDYVRMQWMLLQQPQADDFVIATRVQYVVRQFIQWSAEELGVTLKFDGKGVEETAKIAAIKGDKARALRSATWWSRSTHAASALPRWKHCWAPPPKKSQS